MRRATCKAVAGFAAMSERESSNPPVLLEVEDGIATITLNRSEKCHTLHPEIISALSAIFGKLNCTTDVSVVVLTASGNTFSAGLDIRYLSSLDRDARIGYMRSAFDVFRTLYTLRQPTIAAINGPAVAGGFDLAVFCDLRVSVPQAHFAQPEVILGATQFLFPLYTLIGLGRARELALTGLPIGAREAHRIGLVNHLADPDALIPKARELAEVLAARPQ